MTHNVVFLSKEQANSGEQPVGARGRGADRSLGVMGEDGRRLWKQRRWRRKKWCRSSNVGVSDIRRRLDSPDGSNCGITAHWAPIHGAKLLHVLTHAQALARKGRCASTHGAYGLLLKTCITLRRLATTQVAARRSPVGVTASQLCTITAGASFVMWPWMTLNNVPTKLWLPRPPSIRLWVDCNRFSTHSEDDWQVPSALSGIAKFTFALAEPTHITAAAFVSREQLALFFPSIIVHMMWVMNNGGANLMIFRQFFASTAFRILHLFSSHVIVFIPESLIFIWVYILVFF